MIEANNDEVICPNCVTQFRAVPVNVQQGLIELRAKLAEQTEYAKNAAENYESMHDEFTGKLAELEADAMRYRWLFGARTEAECADEDVGLKPIKPQDRVLSELAVFYAHKEGVDAIVDAAMKGEQPMTSALLTQALDALEMQQAGLQWYRHEYPEAVDASDDEADNEFNAVIAALRTELAKPEPMPVAYLAWRDGKPSWEGDDCVCENAVYPVDSDDDRTSMPVYTKDQL